MKPDIFEMSVCLLTAIGIIIFWDKFR